jgi:hypothetical protein
VTAYTHPGGNLTIDDRTIYFRDAHGNDRVSVAASLDQEEWLHVGTATKTREPATGWSIASCDLKTIRKLWATMGLGEDGFEPFASSVRDRILALATAHDLKAQ